MPMAGAAIEEQALLTGMTLIGSVVTLGAWAGRNPVLWSC
ncbi:hypothetical protein BW21_4618 [Burkholderia humptydooensis]|nr:hypothetical protein BW21_4618 [Burkholderia sp. 2002721687]